MRGSWPAECSRIWHRRSLKTWIFLFLLLILSLFFMVLHIRLTFYGDHHFSMVKLRWDDSNNFRRRHVNYPKRHNMNECPPYFGNVTIFVGYTGEFKQNGMYDVAQRSLECYLKTVNYTLLAVDLDSDPRVNEHCSLHESGPASVRRGMHSKTVDMAHQIMKSLQPGSAVCDTSLSHMKRNRVQSYLDNRQLSPPKGNLKAYPYIGSILGGTPYGSETFEGNVKIFYKKHCAVIQYLPETDWMLVLDADTGIVNPDHCIEEYIDDRVSLILVERFFNWEFAAGNYLVKNSPFAYHFLRSWVDYEFKQEETSWHGNDQGGLMLNVLGLLLPHAEHEYNICEHYWKEATDFETYMKVVICVRLALGSERLWSGKIRIFNKAHGFVRDWWLTKQMWSPEDFMFHGWKNVEHHRGHPFSKTIDPAKCGVGLHGWNWDQKYKKSATELRSALQIAELRYRITFPTKAKIIPLLDAFNVSSCYPQCETV